MPYRPKITVFIQLFYYSSYIFDDLIYKTKDNEQHEGMERA